MFYKNKDALKNYPLWCHQGKGVEEAVVQSEINATFAEITQPPAWAPPIFLQHGLK